MSGSTTSSALWRNRIDRRRSAERQLRSYTRIGQSLVALAIRWYPVALMSACAGPAPGGKWSRHQMRQQQTHMLSLRQQLAESLAERDASLKREAALSAALGVRTAEPANHST